MIETISEKLQNDLVKLRDDSINGAVHITLALLQVLKKELIAHSYLDKDLVAIFNFLQNIHPEMASVQNSVTRLKETFSLKNSNDERIGAIEAEINDVKKREELTIQKLAKELSKYNKIMVLSSSSTVNNALINYHKELIIDEIIVLESRPLFEGRRTAELLAAKGFNVTLVVDAAAAVLAKEIDVIVLGSDVVFEDGTIINKVGSLQLALIADYYKIPLLIGASSNKKTAISVEEYNKFITEKPAVEIWDKMNEKIKRYNIYFEYVPAKFITKIISD